MQINKYLFYQAYRQEFETKLKQSTVDSLEAIIDVFNRGNVRLEHAAYMLATVRHEVGPKMESIVENLHYKTAKRICQVWPARFPTLASAQPYVNNPEKLGNKVYGGRLGNGPNEGYLYRGRGIGAQLTGKVNYEKFQHLLDKALVGYPSLALDPKIGAQILYIGCTRGLFTGKKLADYINDEKVDYVTARKVVNVDVKQNGERIARNAERFEEVLRKSYES